MLQLGWESRVGSNYVCLVLLRILAAACSTFGPKGPRVERDMLHVVCCMLRVAAASDSLATPDTYSY